MAPKALAGSSGLLLFAIWMLVTALAVVAGSERNGGEMELPFQGELQELELPLVRESTTDGSAADSKAKEMEETRKEKSSRKIMTWGGDQCGQCDLNCKRCQCRNCSCVCQKCKRGYLLNGNQCLEVVSTLPPSPNDGGFIVRSGRSRGGFARTFGSWLVPRTDQNRFFTLLG
ncbi:hypothetical protein BSKO_11549 [Bryopsis sp. KO-2023]|nr:hypothetical protein BSKO_11549 [Bryopsis sp. KO-2023]